MCSATEEVKLKFVSIIRNFNLNSHLAVAAIGQHRSGARAGGAVC